jgi:hypothetical protein
MSMSQGERIRRIEEEAKRYISRNKVRDASELTHIRRAKASSNEIPTSVQDIQYVNGCAMTVQIKGKGTHMEYLNVLQAAESAAICGSADPSDIVNLGTYIPAPCYDRSKPPFAQQDLTVPANLYVTACKPAAEQYFPRIVDSTCVYDRVITPSG